MNINIDLSQFKEWATENRKLALTVCQAEAVATVIRKKVDDYINPIFESFKFTYCGDLAERLDRRAGEKLLGTALKREDLHLCDDQRLQEYFDACDAAHRAHGYDLPKGHCPALQAENLLIQAQGALIESAKPIAGIKCYMLIGAHLEKEYLDLLIKACLADATKDEINRHIAPLTASRAN
jgi:hypothetical protein